MAAERLTATISVLVVDDHPLVRRCLREALEDDPGITVVGSAGDGVEAVGLARELRPEVVVMDRAMPAMDGIEATREILRFAPDTLVLIISMSADEASVRAAREAGAQGFLEKNAAGFDLPNAVKAAAGGYLQARWAASRKE